MIAFPIGAAAVSLVFGAHLLARYSRRGAAHEGVWGLAMLMFAAGSAALALGVWDGWTAGEFRAYWLFGAVLNVPYLAQGELYLLLQGRSTIALPFGIGRVQRRRVAQAAFIVLLAATAWALAEVRAAAVDPIHLGEEFPLGRDVFGAGTAAHRLAQFYAFPAYFLLLGGAVYSAGRIRGREDLRARFYGTGLVAVGATVVAIGSGIGAGFGNFALFSTALAGGAALMYWGFLVAVRPPGTAERLGEAHRSAEAGP